LPRITHHVNSGTCQARPLPKDLHFKTKAGGMTRRQTYTQTKKQTNTHTATHKTNLQKEKLTNNPTNGPTSPPPTPTGKYAHPQLGSIRVC